MPMVPDNFAPGVSQGEMPMTPAGGPWVSPMRNSAPGLLQQTGQTLTQAGDMEARLGNTIGDRVQETVDDGMTKAAVNQFLGSALPTLGQYKTTEGMNATRQFDPAAQAISKARQDARASLTNPIQQHMFDQVSNDHMLTFVQQMADHAHGQTVQYGKDQAKASAESMNAMATLDVAGRNRDDSNFAKLGAQSDLEVLHFAGLNGIAPDSPQAEQMLRQNRTERYRSVISSLHDQHAYSEELDFFNDHKGEMDVRQAEVIGNLVKSDVLQTQGTDLMNQAIQSLGNTKGAGPLTAPIPAGTISTTPGVDGIDIHTAPGTNVHAPASGTVTKVWTSPEQGLSAQIALPSGYTATFSGLGAVNYKEGQKITEGQVLGVSGQDDSGRAFTHYAMTDPSGRFVDPRQAASAPYDPQNFSTPEDEAKAVSWLNSNVDDPVVRRGAVDRLEYLANHNRGMQNQAHSDAVKQAMNYAVQHGGSIAGLPADVLSLLSPVDVDSFNQQAKVKNDVGLLANWIQHPEQQTVNSVTLAHQQGRLSDSGYLTALRGAMALQGQDTNSTDPQKVRAVTVDHDQLTNILGLNNLPYLAQPETAGDPAAKASAQLQRIQLEEAIKSEIDVQQQKNNRVLSWQEKGKIMRDMVIDKVYTSGFNSNSGLKPMALTTPDERKKATVWIGNQKVRMADVPRQYAQQAIQDLQANRMPATQANIAAWWLRKGEPTR